MYTHADIHIDIMKHRKQPTHFQPYTIGYTDVRRLDYTPTLLYSSHEFHAKIDKRIVLFYIFFYKKWAIFSVFKRKPKIT